MKPSQKLAIACAAGLFGIWATSSLGFWQLRRAAGKEALQARSEVAARATPMRPDAATLRDSAGLVAHHLRFRGAWVPEHTVYLDNRPQNGQPGFYVLMGLRLEDAATHEVVVNRGWTPRAIDDRRRIAPYTTPAGIVDVTGVALADEPHLLELAAPAEQRLQTIWQNFDFAAFMRASGQAPLPLVLRQDAGERSAPGDGLVRDWPDRGGVLQGQIDRHHGYAFQWFALSATLAALLLYRVFRAFQRGRALRILMPPSTPPSQDHPGEVRTEAPIEAQTALQQRRSRLKLWLVVAICVAPVIASYCAYYFVKPSARSNYGTLIEPQRPVPPLVLKTLDGRPFDTAALRGKWTMLMVAGGECPAACVDRLYHLRQVRLTTGRERDRVQRVWLIPDQVPLSTMLIREYDGTDMLRADPADLANWLPHDPAEPADAWKDHIYIVDPLGNLMMRFPLDADPNKTKRDIAKLLSASRIG